MRLRGVLLIVTLLGWVSWDLGAANAQPGGAMAEFAVDELVARALGDNPDLRAARAEVEAAVGRLRQAGLRPNPMLELSGQRSVTSPDNNVMVGMTIPLDLNRRKEGRVGVADRELEMKRAQVGDRERRLRTEVRMKGGELLAARRNLRFTEELLRVNRDALGVLRERVRQGAAPPLEESLLLVEVNRLDANRRILESRVEITTLQLKLLAGMGPDAPLSVRGDLTPVPPRFTRPDGLMRALEARPDLTFARAEAAMARAKIEKEKAEGRWDASINFGYQRMASGFDLMGLTESGATRPIEDVFHFFGLGVTIMLPFRNRNEGNVAAAAAEAQAADRRLEFATLVLRQEVSAAFTQYEAAKRSLEIYGRGVREVARQNLEIVRQTYELGRTSLLDVIAEQRRYIDIETGYTESLRQVYDAAVEIERAVGTVDR